MLDNIKRQQSEVISNYQKLETGFQVFFWLLHYGLYLNPDSFFSLKSLRDFILPCQDMTWANSKLSVLLIVTVLTPYQSVTDGA